MFLRVIPWVKCSLRIEGMNVSIMIPFSIILTAYNTADYLQKCLDSIEHQTYFKDNNEYEILLGIDGCDKSLNKMIEIKNRYRNLKVLYMEKNAGTYITANTLIQQAVYDNIIKFDTDDIMKPEMIETLAHYSEMHDIIRFRSHNFRNGRIKSVRLGMVAGGVFFCKKHIFDTIGCFKPWVCGADTDFIYRVYKIRPRVKQKVIQTPLFFRRIRADSLTQSPETSRKSEIRQHYRTQYTRSAKYEEPVVNEWQLI